MPEATHDDDSLDPRVVRSRRVICEAALAELGEVGYGAMSIESIAKRAGVGKATVYRHWNGKLDLLESALDTVKDDIPAMEQGTARERVVARLAWLADYLASPDRSGALPAIVSAAVFDESVRVFHREFSHGRRQQLADVIREGVDSGEFDLPADVDTHLVAESLVGPLFFRRLMTGEIFPPERIHEIIDVVIGPG